MEEYFKKAMIDTDEQTVWVSETDLKMHLVREKETGNTFVAIGKYRVSPMHTTNSTEEAKNWGQGMALFAEISANVVAAFSAAENENNNNNE